MTEAKELEDQISPTREKELEDRIDKLIQFLNSLIGDIRHELEDQMPPEEEPGDLLRKLFLRDEMPPTREKELEDRIIDLVHFSNSLMSDLKYLFKVYSADYKVLKKSVQNRNDQ
jgi:NTP pyrophosphatase (non-canonical NTP hydrolase)